MQRDFTLAAVGDLILDAPDPERYFEPSSALLGQFDVVVGHVETPYSLRGFEESTDVPSPPASPDQLRALREGHVAVATLAGNHIADRGALGVLDTVKALHALGIATAGAGESLPVAREPAVVERAGRRVGTLSYNCVGPDGARATSGKAGAACLDVHTVYGRPFGGPGAMPMEVTTYVDRRSVDLLVEDVTRLRPRVDVLVVALHKGILHVPAEVADYEVDLAHAAIDAGADAVVGHHAHILKGVEFHRGRPIFHGLGNFVTVTQALRPTPDNTPERLAWVGRRRLLTGFDPDPAMPYYPFHPESRNSGVAVLRWRGDDGPTVEFHPCWIDGDARPVPVSGDQGRAVVDYLADISARAGFSVRATWNGRHATFEPG